MTHLPCDHEPHSISTSKSIRIPKYNAKRSFRLAFATTRLSLFFLRTFEIQSRFSVENVFIHDLADLPCNHEPDSSIKSTRIPIYKRMRSF
ncbi:uncharacterized protein G2W53_004375 [Senna tora]|uniref:Uncharacterized protein n=1 Tax=Senna tora TaxID=362788 RepID=A0A834XCY7_9FABA|nr:uncharacterized protein G2W53_004375 [Senna tora]